MKDLGVAKAALPALAVALALLLATGAKAQIPQYPTIITGFVTIDGNPAPGGKSVWALIEGTLCDTAVTANNGSYLLSVGGRAGIQLVCDNVGAIITFQVDGVAVPETTVRQPAAQVTLNLTVTTATPTPLPTVPLVQGLNVIQYRGAMLPAEQALSNCLSAVDGVFLWNTAAQAWSWWLKGAPAGVNTLLSLNPGAIVWVIASAVCNWAQPT